MTRIVASLTRLRSLAKFKSDTCLVPRANNCSTRQMIPTRRNFLRAAGGLLLAPTLTTIVPFARRASAEEVSWRHGLSLFGQLQYPCGSLISHMSTRRR